jgi:diacylglycerol O-acyltransferase
MAAHETLSPLDATFLELEQTDHTAHMHIGGLLVFDPLPGGGAPTLARLRRHLDRRLDALPRYRKRLSQPTTGGLRWPSWIPDEHFDMGVHVTRAALPKPGGERELLDWTADFWSHRLDRARPLWRMVLLEGLAGGRWALVTKTHHSLVDGVGSIDVGTVLLDTAPVPPRRRGAPPAAAAERAHHGTLRRLIEAPVGVAKAAAVVVSHPDQAADAFHAAKGLAELLVRDELVAAPKTSLNVPLGEHRRLVVADVSLAELKAVKRELGGTVNDVVVALVTAGLRALLLERGETPPEAGLRAMVPVNVRDAADHLGLGNRISSLFVHLPVAAETTEARYERVRAETTSLKAGDQAAGSSALVALAGLAPPVVHSVVAQSLFATRLFNVTVTNVPGPQSTLYAFGAPMRRAVPLVPLAAEHAAGIPALSYDGSVCICVHADRDTVPDAARITDGIKAELRALRALAARHPAGRGRR